MAGLPDTLFTGLFRPELRVLFFTLWFATPELDLTLALVVTEVVVVFEAVDDTLGILGIGGREATLLAVGALGKILDRDRVPLVGVETEVDVDEDWLRRSERSEVLRPLDVVFTGGVKVTDAEVAEVMLRGFRRIVALASFGSALLNALLLLTTPAFPLLPDLSEDFPEADKDERYSCTTSRSLLASSPAA